MKYLHFSLVALVAAGSLAAVASGALAATHSAGGGVKVAVAGSKLGRILVDGRGRTLYLFERDKRGKSTCSGQCASFWPPLITTTRPQATAGAKASLLGTTKRADGRLQVTYDHHPLYSFVKDSKKGQTNGEALNVFGADWYAVSPSGATVEKSDATANDGNPTSSPSGGSGGYGY